MKAIKNSIIPFLVLAIFTLSFTRIDNAKQTVLIQSSEKNISSDVLEQSAVIISKRLTDFDAGKFIVSVIPAKNQIKVTFTDDLDFQVIEDIIVHKGIVEFYETYDHNELLELLNGNDGLFNLLAKSDVDNDGTKAGCTTASEVARVTEYLHSLGVEKKCKFAWSNDFDKSQVCLYALKLTDGTGPIVTGSDIESAVYDQDRIKIKMKSNAVAILADATRRNLDKVISCLLYTS